MKHTEIIKHPLRDAYMVINKTCQFVPPFIGTLKECEKAQAAAERSAEEYINQHNK